MTPIGNGLRAACLAAVVALCGCSTPESAPASGDSASAAETPARSVVSDDALRDIMTAKLVHANALSNAIVVRDLGRVEQDARELAFLGTMAEWRVHDTSEYARLSTEFRAIVEQIAEDAAAGRVYELDQLRIDMAASCTECHAYLRKEGLVPGVPGAVSMRRPPHPATFGDR
jgi:hypothetical protein